MRLKLSLLQNDPPHDDAYPFKQLDDTHPTSRIIEAAFMTDAGSLLKKVVLQVQRDRYALPGAQCRPLTNLSIDLSWQQAFRARAAGVGQVLLSSQSGSQDEFRPLDPLFFCRERGLFFHPVCPGCAQPLTLCTDEILLANAGLSPYASSLKRYLHCSSCCSHRPAEFYVYQSDHGDPLAVKDRWGLIDQFKQVTACMDPGLFPCAGCQEHDSCYGTPQMARTRIAPFSFYPFYLLIHEASPLSAVDCLTREEPIPASRWNPDEADETMETVLLPPGHAPQSCTLRHAQDVVTAETDLLGETLCPPQGVRTRRAK